MKSKFEIRLRVSSVLHEAIEERAKRRSQEEGRNISLVQTLLECFCEVEGLPQNLAKRKSARKKAEMSSEETLHVMLGLMWLLNIQTEFDPLLVLQELDYSKAYAYSNMTDRGKKSQIIFDALNETQKKLESNQLPLEQYWKLFEGKGRTAHRVGLLLQAGLEAKTHFKSTYDVDQALKT